VENLGAGPQRFGKRGQADRHHHEFLQVHVAVGVRAAVEDVHHRHRQQIRRVARARARERGEVGVERDAGSGGGRRAIAIDTPSVAFAPSRLLDGVPSSVTSTLSRSR
jgi:hypothetical protein